MLVVCLPPCLPQEISHAQANATFGLAGARAARQRPRHRQTRLTEKHSFAERTRRRTHTLPTALDNGRRSPRKLLRAVVARLLGRKP